MSEERADAERARRHVAIHEAGHAVVAHLLGCPPGLVEIEEHSGRYEFIAPPVSMTAWASMDKRRRQRAFRDAHRRAFVTVLLAGIEAELRATGFVLEHALPERDEAYSHCGKGEQALECYVRAGRRARRLLDQGWPAVEALSAALLESGRLEAPQVRAVIESALAGAGQQP